MPSLEDLEAKIRQLEARLPGGLYTTTQFGRSETLPNQIGFPAILLGPYDKTFAYPWARLLFQSQVPAINPDAIPLTGNMAMTTDNNKTLLAGTRGWMERDTQACGWIFIPDLTVSQCTPTQFPGPSGSTSGSVSGVCQCPGDGKDPLVMLCPPTIIGNQLWVQCAQLAVYLDQSGKLRLCEYNVQQIFVGCIGCPSGSGSGTSGSGSGSSPACCSPGQTIPFKMTASACCLWTTPGCLIGGGTVSGNTFSGVLTQFGPNAWTGILTIACPGGFSSALSIYLYCVGQNTWELVLQCGGVNPTTYQISNPPCAPFCLTYNNVYTGNGTDGTGCCCEGQSGPVANGPITVVIGTCEGSGSGSSSGSGGGGGSCPTSGTVTIGLFWPSAPDGCANANGSYVLNWNGTNFSNSFTPGLGFQVTSISFTCTGVSGSTMTGTVTVNGVCTTSGTWSFTATVSGTASPMDLMGTGTVAGNCFCSANAAITVTS